MKKFSLSNRHKDLLVTFPVDLGNRTYESNLHQLFSEEMDFFRFAAQHANELDKGIDYARSRRDRLSSIFSLRNTVSKYSNAGSTVLFHGLSPAFLSYGAWRPSKTAILLDWTRCLYPSVLGYPVTKNWVWYLHRKVLRSCPKILCMTDAVMNNLQEYYDIPLPQLFRIPAPFYVKSLDIPPRPTPSIPRVLFIGGDLKRKGGNILLNAWEQRLQSHCHLTMLTNDPAADIAGVNYLPGITYGTPEHKNVFKEHDILILPTQIDSYPQAIGEAAAAGLVVITTRFALGSPDIVLPGISGYIEETAEACLDRLVELIKQNNKIDSMKVAGYNQMHANFSTESIKKQYAEIIKN